MIAILVFLYFPIVIIVWASFNETEVIRFPIRSYSFEWYEKLFRNEQIHLALINSLIVSVFASIFSIIFGVPLAVGIQRYGDRSRRFLSALVATPMMTPRLIIGIAILNLLVVLRVPLSLYSVVLGHMVMVLPYVVLIVGARYANSDRFVEEAAWDLGSSRLRTFLQITLPSLRPAIFGALLISFTLSFDEVVISFFLTGVDTTLPVQLWSMLRFGISPEINALATLTLFVSITFAVMAEVAIRISGR